MAIFRGSASIPGDLFKVAWVEGTSLGRMDAAEP